MNKVILLVLLMPVTAFGQLIENFESASLSAWIQSPEGHWSADNSNPISGTGSLHQSFDNAESGTDLIGISLENLHPEASTTTWSFIIRYGCDPSSSNNWALFLMADISPGTSEGSPGLNGYAVGVNQTGYDDTLRLWKIRNGIFSTVIKTDVNWQTSVGTAVSLRISVRRSISGQWTMEIHRPDNSLIGSFAGQDNELFKPGWFTVLYRYTSTRDRLLWIDDISIEGTFREDKEPPVLKSLVITGINSLRISFDEELQEFNLYPDDFILLPGNIKPLRIIRKSVSSLFLEFEHPFQNKTTNRLVLKNLCDRHFNCLKDYDYDFFPSWPDPGDIVLSEIMADPSPSVTLPEKEYVELYNRSPFPVNLKNWILSDGVTNSILPLKIINPGEYLILCQVPDTILFRNFGSTAGLKSFPALSDAGKLLVLKDTTLKLIDGIKYSSSWYRDNLKSDGGWSLEIIDKDRPFSADDNWRASITPMGGTPGSANSVSARNPDQDFHGILNVFPDDSCSIRIRLSETVTDLTGKTGSIEIGNYELSSISFPDLLMQEFIVRLKKPLHRGQIYSLKMGEDVRDFAGNSMGRSEFRFGLPETASRDEILFNELLFNPLPGDPDFAELFNVSEKIIDVSSLFMVSVNDELHDTSSVAILSQEKRCFLPAEYYAVTTDKKKITERFTAADHERIFEINSLPSMPDDKGHLLLFNNKLDKADEVRYDAGMHYPLLNSDEGISLEKIRVYGNSSDRSNWHSSSETSGWGTPGAPNSVLAIETEGKDLASLSSSKITPDNDGYEDFLIVDLNLTGIGNVVSVSVFDEAGRFVKKLTDNLLAGNNASIIWNGTGADEKLVGTGIYILLIEVFNVEGKVLRWKRVCTVIRR